MMPIENIPDWEMRLKRQDAFWSGAILDRPVVHITLGRNPPVREWPPAKGWKTVRERWLDTEHVAACAVSAVANTEYLGDALPAVFPNLGPEVFSAFYGCELEYSESTSWSVPNLHGWKDAGKIRFSEDNFYWKKIVELTDALLAAGKGRFYTGITDMHPGGDAIAAFRDPLNLNLDLIEAPGHVKKLLKRVNRDYFRVYDFYYRKLTAAGQAICSWPGIVSTQKWYVPSNDFSCMVSKAMFDDLFLPGLIAECRQLDASIYHLDGPQALQHLDSLLAIPELNAIQWVYGAGHGRASDWMHIYKKCQAAGKGLQLGLALDELDFFMENLRPEGLWLGIQGVENHEQAGAAIAKISRWK